MKTATCEHCGQPTEPAVTNPRRFCLTCAPDQNAYGRLYRHYRHYLNGRNARGQAYKRQGLERTTPRDAHMTRIEPPPGPWTWTEALALAAACTTLQRIHGRGTLSAIATLTEDEYDTWSAAVRLHRDAWRHHLNGLRGEAQTAIDRVNHADEAFTEQGRAVGWLHEHPSTYTTPTVPIIHADEAACSLLTVLGPRDARQWSWELARAVREHTRARLN